jgi:hypothetical protein
MTKKNKGKNAAAAAMTYQQEKEKTKTPQIRIEGVRYDVPNKQVGQKTFKKLLPKTQLFP